MRQGRFDLLPGTITDVFSSLSVGVWSWDIEPDVVRLCPVSSRLLGISLEDGERGLPASRCTSKILLQDRQARRDVIKAAMERGGLFVTEYRTEPHPGQIKWVLTRGCFEADPDGVVRHAHGISIDVTDSHADNQVGSREFFASGIEPASTLVERAADLAMELWRVQERFGADETLDYGPELRVILMKIGRRLAADMRLSSIGDGLSAKH